VTKCALQLVPLVFVRPGKLRKAEWEEIDLDQAEWRIPGAKMKMSEVHIVSLATQVVTILRDLNKLTGTGRYLFPGARTHGRPMSGNTINAALRRLDYGSAVDSTDRCYRLVKPLGGRFIAYSPSIAHTGASLQKIFPCASCQESKAAFRRRASCQIRKLIESHPLNVRPGTAKLQCCPGDGNRSARPPSKSTVVPLFQLEPVMDLGRGLGLSEPGRCKGATGNSDRMRSACGPALACQPMRALQARRRDSNGLRREAATPQMAGYGGLQTPS
jgi:hypothetical protein